MTVKEAIKVVLQIIDEHQSHLLRETGHPGDCADEIAYEVRQRFKVKNEEA